MNGAHAVRASGCVVNDVDGSGECRGAEVHRGGAAQHLDAFHVVQGDRFDLRDEGAAGGNTVDQ